MDQRLALALLAASLLVLLAALAVRLSSRVGLPTLLIYLAIGMAIGEAGLGVGFQDYRLARNLGLIALAVILADGGLSTRWAVVRPQMAFAAALATAGVAICVAVVAFTAWAALGLDPRTSVLLGAAVSATDAAAVFSVLRRLPISRSVAAALEAESGLNDAPVVTLVAVVASGAWQQGAWGAAAGLIVYELAAGAAIGAVIGAAGQQLLIRAALPAAGLYPLATLAVAAVSFSAASAAHASGFAAVYVTTLWLGNAVLPHRRATLGFANGMGWLAHIGLFIMLGLLASPLRLPGAVLPALAVGGVLTLLARPLAVAGCAAWFAIPRRDQVFLSWAGLRGAVPIVLATIPLTAHLPGASRLFDIVFLLVVVFTLIQAPTLPWLGRRLGVVSAGESSDLDVESAPLDALHSDLLEVTVPDGSQLAGVYLDELRLPVGAAVALISRGGRSFVPDEHTSLSVGDTMLIVTATGQREATERRLRAVSRRGKLARWYGESGDVQPARVPRPPGGAVTGVFGRRWRRWRRGRGA